MFAKKIAMCLLAICCFTVWILAVNFDDGGNFESAKVLCED